MNCSPRLRPKTYWFAPSKKKERFSGKNSGKRVRLIWRVSTSVSAKSVFAVNTVTNCGVIFQVTSPPTAPCHDRDDPAPQHCLVFPIAYGVISRPFPCWTSPTPDKRPARLRSYRNESNVGDDQRSHRRSRGINRSRFSPQSLRPGVKLKVRDGMPISADHPSGILAVRASQIPSQSREALSAVEISPSTRVPAALIRKKYPVRRSPDRKSTRLNSSHSQIS